ncbi:MAG TPA: multidrug effflux MFS transporter [Cyclobacteriaceae bacterium]|nr:multidrug effflux MFS transporter [Cyclobacteriaceae bacterium]
MTRKQHVITILILGALATISPFSIDMYLPGFPAIAADLHTSIARVQLSLTSYLIGIAVGQLLYGPLLDRFGRKTPLYFGLAVYVLASLVCAFTNSVDALIAMRLLQALGGCAGIVAAQALIRDLFPVNEIAQAFSSITLVIAVSPMIAPTVGGYVTAAFGWHYVFIILAGLTALILIAVYFVLPTGRTADTSLSLRPGAVMKNFNSVFRHPQFLVYMLTGGIATSAGFAYIAGSSEVMITILGFTEQQYGWIFAFLAFGLIGSTQLNHILLKRFTSQQLILAALVYQTVVGLVLVVGTWYHWLSPLGLIGLMFVFLTGQGLTNPNATALTLAPFVRHTGSAASLNGFFRMAIGGLVTGLVSLLHNSTAMPMVGVMVGCAVVGLIVLLIGNSVVRFQASKKVEEEDSVLL